MIPILIPIPVYYKGFDSNSDFDSSIMRFQFWIQCLVNSMIPIPIPIPTNWALIPLLIPESDYDIIYNSEMYGIECITKVINWDLEYGVAFL